MSIQKTLGGDRLGSGKKMKVSLNNYERSTHDIGSIWRSTMAPGTLVPFMSKVALPGDTWDIELNADVKTHPTIGPLFGSAKLQLDVFVCPVRLYQGQLHNNKLGIGNNMSKVKLPIVKVNLNNLDVNSSRPLELQHFSQSAIFPYLGQRGMRKNQIPSENVEGEFNAVPYLSYWDIYKNYYANKQEEIGVVCNNKAATMGMFFVNSILDNGNILTSGNGNKVTTLNVTSANLNWNDRYFEILVNGTDLTSYLGLKCGISDTETGVVTVVNADTVFDLSIRNDRIICRRNNSLPNGTKWIRNFQVDDQAYVYEGVNLVNFPLENLDTMRELILTDVRSTAPFEITSTSITPYSLPLKAIGDGVKNGVYARFPMEGLAIKTYQSDIFNNWLSTDWIDGSDGINSITAIDTSDGSFTIDTLTLSRKVYNMLNRIAVSGGTYDDWTQAVYTHESFRRAETPIYMGGLSKEIVFQEVVSSSDVNTDDGAMPLGTLAGRGRLNDKHKGGKLSIKIDELSYIIGIVSITPRIDYSQGNSWDMELKTMDDFHKPALDQIGFQDLLTEQMAFWDSYYIPDGTVVKPSAGKQPAWINYMTDFNKTYGGFADEGSEMFMTFNRRYEVDKSTFNIKDLTSYIDPAKFNYAFAVVDRSAQNFWVQIAADTTARRIMSAKVMPNL